MDFNKNNKIEPMPVTMENEGNTDREPSQPTVEPDNELERHCLWRAKTMEVFNTLYKRMSGHELESLYLRPVSDADWPGYSAQVTHPMDMATVLRNINSGVIRTTEEFRRDVWLILFNALSFTSQALYDSNRSHRMAEELLLDTYYYLYMNQLHKPKLASLRRCYSDDYTSDTNTVKNKGYTEQKRSSLRRMTSKLTEVQEPTTSKATQLEDSGPKVTATVAEEFALVEEKIKRFQKPESPPRNDISILMDVKDIPLLVTGSDPIVPLDHASISLFPGPKTVPVENKVNTEQKRSACTQTVVEPDSENKANERPRYSGYHRWKNTAFIILEGINHIMRKHHRVYLVQRALEPATRDWPRYEVGLHVPMDIEKIRNSISCGFIRTTKQFKRAVLLWLINAVLMTEETNSLYKVTKDTLKNGRKYLNRSIKYLLPADDWSSSSDSSS